MHTVGTRETSLWQQTVTGSDNILEHTKDDNIPSRLPQDPLDLITPSYLGQNNDLSDAILPASTALSLDPFTTVEQHFKIYI